MAKRFMYVSFGVLALVAAHQLGTERAQADGRHSGFVVAATSRHAWNAFGEGYERDGATGAWIRRPNLDLPVPSTEVKALAGSSGDIHLVTTDDRIWWNPIDSWIELAPLPGGPVALEQGSWGSIKAQSR